MIVTQCIQHNFVIAILTIELLFNFFLQSFDSQKFDSDFGVGAFLQATSRVPRWWIGERPPDMAASCDIYK